MEALAYLKTTVPGHVYVLDISQTTWSKRFAQVLHALGFPKGFFTLGSLRGGAATEDFLEHENLPRVQYKGRWRNLASVGHYLQIATAALAAIDMSARTQKLVDILDELAPAIFPPTPELLDRAFQH